MSDDFQLLPRDPARRKRDPRITRTVILEAAKSQLAKDGPWGLRMSRVAHHAGVNRGTAYQHFQTREHLLEATTAWVGEKLMRALFYDQELGARLELGQINPQYVVEHLSQFAMENPELGKAWLFEVLSSGRSAHDPFWNLFKANCESFAKSQFAQSGIDAEVHAVVTLVGMLLWPVWACGYTRTAEERHKLMQRYSNELLRLNMYGTMRPEKFKDLVLKRRRPRT